MPVPDLAKPNRAQSRHLCVPAEQDDLSVDLLDEPAAVRWKLGH